MRLFTSAALLAATLSALAQPACASPMDPSIIPALVLSTGRVDSRQDETGAGSGIFFDGNYTRTFLNGGVSYKTFANGDDFPNLYVGTGFSKLLQLQFGLSANGGTVRRVRHDLNLTSIHDFFTGTRRNRYNTSLGNRLTLTFALENYSKDKRFDNFHIGGGLPY
jgi:hypothetical protein